MSLKIESSLTDLMTSLAIVFIMLMLALVNSIGNAGKTDIGKIQHELESALIEYELACVNNSEKGDPLSCTIVLPKDKLPFAPGSPYIDHKGQDYLNKIFPKIMNVLSNGEIIDSVEGIYIEGFTDDTASDIYNLALSQDRSREVGLHLLISVFSIKASVVRRNLLEWMHLNGRGEQDLVLNSKDDIDRGKSRRVEVTIRVKTLQQREVAEEVIEGEESEI